VTLTFELLNMKVVSESRVTWATFVPILVFLGLSVLDIGPMYATDRQTSDAHHRLMPPLYGGEGIINKYASVTAANRCQLFKIKILMTTRESEVHNIGISR